MLFTIMASGYRVQCALAENDTGDIRLDKLCRLIRGSGKSVHDLSRIEVNTEGFPRFNMPFELGLYLGAHRFGGKTHNIKSTLVMIKTKYKLPIYLSDLGGNDPKAHDGVPIEVIRIVRAYLKAKPNGGTLPGAQRMFETFEAFKTNLPSLAEALELKPEELDPYRDYADYVILLEQFLKEV